MKRVLEKKSFKFNKDRDQAIRELLTHFVYTDYWTDKLGSALIPFSDITFDPEARLMEINNCFVIGMNLLLQGPWWLTLL